MFPLSLTLKGFRGIRDGLGLDVLTLDLERLAGEAALVALAGANGRGKSTILDNLHPFLTMPSRASAAGAGGFSYYDQVCLAEAEKDLVWLHEGRRYRSHVVIRDTGRRATDAFLFEAGSDGRWRPVELPDGTVSDGKTGTYVRCVEHVLGSAETFFTSAFSAQGKRQLSSYQNGEIKTLLADLLGQEEIRNEGKKAGQVADLLKAGLVAFRQQQATLDEQIERIGREHRRLEGANERVRERAAAWKAAQSTLETTRERLAQHRAAREQASGTEAARTRLAGERATLIRAGKDAIEAIGAQEKSQRDRLERLEQRIGTRRTQRSARLQALTRQRRQCEAVLEHEVGVRRVGRRLVLAEAVAAGRTARVRAAREQVQELARCDSAMEAAGLRVKTIEREAGQAALRAEDLARRFGLAREVPCSGTDLQGQCKLLGDAREAQALMPSAQGAIRRLADDKTATQRQADALAVRRRALDAAPQALSWAEFRESVARGRAEQYGRLSQRAGEVDQARLRCEEIDGELVGLQAPDEGTTDETAEEVAERRDIAATLDELAARHQQQAKYYRQSLDRLDEALAALPPAFDERRLTAAERAVTEAQAAAGEAERAHLQAVRDVESRAALDRQRGERRRERQELGAHIARVEAQLGSWNLLTKCLSNDGVIALAIDDAGPALAGLANDLLLACYGARFTVSLLTQLETRKGEQREGFAIEVHDGKSGQSKRVEQMSGGERVWINECLVRAVALYLAQNSGRCYGTLFSDEADGALDPSRKRMFMAMKREVLRLGGYVREIYISQTPELTAMADAVIDLDGVATAAMPRASRATNCAAGTA
ncbi:AAA family ATPase [Ottowia sp.]|uniref:AAA family ATPase n=1 Tax=Ottowia sp. TaxID=1898956 RepID=UPI00263081B7|nr:AAA family ATPase [Ottowia sp.]